MRPSPRVVAAVAAGTGAVVVAVGANLLLIGQAPEVAPVGRLSPALAVTVQAPDAAPGTTTRSGTTRPAATTAPATTDDDRPRTDDDDGRTRTDDDRDREDHDRDDD